MLRDLALLEMAPYKVGDKPRWTIEGPDVLLLPRAILALSLGLHELATNASKYGALATAEGHVKLQWDVRQVDDERRLYIVWSESGGPEVRTPSSRGFGSRLIEQGLKHELGGRVSLEFDPAGVRCTIDMPLAASESAS
jgi:two-component sensor histidine kinase